MGVLSNVGLGADPAAQEEHRRAEEVRSGARAPTRAERQRCWESRDLYFGCLDRHSIIDPLKDDKAAAKACPDEGKLFERDCAAQWVEHFKKFRLANYQKEQRLRALAEQGANVVQLDDGPASNSIQTQRK